VVFIQVPFESERSAATENQFRSYCELCNETSRQVHKTSVNILCSYIQNLQVMQFRCLRVNGALHVMCVQKTIRVMWKCLRDSLHVSVILTCVCFQKIDFWKIFNNETPIRKTSKKNKDVTNFLKTFCCRKTKRFFVDH